MLNFSEQELKCLLEDTPDGIHIIDQKGDLVFFSKSFMNNLGYNKEEMLDLNVVDWDPLAPSKQLRSVIADLINKPEIFISKHKRKDGSVIDVEINAKGIVINNEKYLFASQRNIQKRDTTQVDLANKLLASERIKYKTILELASDGVFIMDFEGKLIDYSKKAQDLLGYSDSEMQSLCVYDWDKAITKEEYSQIILALKEGPIEVEREHTRKDNSKYIAFITANIINLNNEDFLYASARDITSQKENEKTIIEQNEQLEAIFNTALGGICLLNLEGKYEFVNNKYCEMLEYTSQEILNKSTFDFIDKTFIDLYKQSFQDVIEKGVYEDLEIVCITKSGETRRLRSSIALMPNKNQFLMTTVDNTDLFNAMNTIKRQTYIDDLTKLYNKKSYNDKIKESLDNYEKYNISFSIIIFDIDHFKRINDTQGHLVGDKVLAYLGRLISNNIRKDDLAFRIGGEEFALLLRNTSLKSALIVAEKLRNIIETESLVLSNETITISLGVTEVRNHDDTDSIYKRADGLLYQAKHQGRNQVVSE
ncbi:diguanylate cyclase [Francisella sciaenopsi]|uniref:diguanylate cyclase n=1 Tax=Francisella sciaenopsi TaxID=3055034 RepID=A0ABQ6PCS6_9GAMM